MSDAAQSVRQHIMAVAAMATLLLCGLAVMGASTELSGAVMASGSVVVESSVKTVQHPTGGVLKDLLVKEGDRVQAGQLLIRLDETVAQANLSAVTKNLWELEARLARLDAERDGKTEIDFPPDLTAVASDPAAAAIMAGERRLLKLRFDARDGQKRQLNERIAQLRQEINGLDDQLNAKKEESGLLQKELSGVQQLWDQKLVALPRLVSLQRDAARLLGERGRLTASIAQAKGKISEMEIKILQIDQDFRSDVAKELADVRAKRAETYEKQVAARDQAQKLDIRTPQSGIVHDLRAHTKGGVIKPGETIMTIVPDHDMLVVEAHVAPRDIDQVKLDQAAVLRFTNFDWRSTPELNGKVVHIGADVSRDDEAKSTYYDVRVAITRDELKRLPAGRLLPGMPVDVFIRTAQRSLLSYLFKPLADQAHRAFREN